MENSNLIELLKTLTTKELERFHTFTETPYFTIGRYRRDAQLLLRALFKQAPHYENAKLSKLQIHNWVFSGADYTEGRLEKAMVDAHKMLRQFLLTEQYFSEDNYYHTQLHFAKILRKKGLTQKSAGQVKSLLDLLESKTSKVSEDYYLLYEASAQSNVIESQKSKLNNDVTNSLHYLDLAYYSKRLIMLNYHLNSSTFARMDMDVDVEKEKTFAQIFTVSLEESPDLFIAQKIFHLYAEKRQTVEDFNALLTLLTQYENVIESESLKQYFTYVRSYCTHLINNGNTELIPILHRINKDNLSKGYFYYLESLTSTAYLNVANVALKTGDIAWTKEFIESHKYRILGDNETHDYYRLTFANYLFYTKAFEDALDFLPPSSPHLGFHLMARKLELMIYFEIKSPLLEPKLDAFRMYLTRASKKVLPEDIKEWHANFVNFLHQIIQSKPGDKKRGEVIVNRIKEKKMVPMAEWLMEKAQKLK